MSQNNFLLPVENYQRSINPIADWVKQTAFYASRMTGKPFEACRQHLITKLKNGTIPFKNPTVVHFERAENGDTEKTTTPLTHYIRATVERNEILAPTFTTYLHPSVKRSVIVEYLDINVAQRKTYKKASQRYEAEGDIGKFKYYHNAQDSAKRRNNSVSGGFVAEGSVIKNKSAHSTLTSTTRSIASLSNASNERLVEGNRHYFTFQIALNNIISIATEIDHVCVDKAVSSFGLVYPSVSETMACIKRSTDLYWRDTKALLEIEKFVNVLTPTERAGVVYTGDLYHIRVFNDAFARQFLSDLSRRGDATPINDVTDVLYKTDEQIVNYAHQINISALEGVGKDYAKISEHDRYVVANTCRNIEKTIEQYKLFLEAFFLTKNSPCTVATIPSMIRRSVVLSDTDSTMFSVDNWVDWYFGTLRFDDEAYALSGAIMFMATQAIAHILAIFSANMNVERSRLFTLAMKPEYVFPVFAQTSVAKHYYTAMKVKEGSVYKGIKMEIKGVHMKDSSVPTTIIKSAASEMRSIIEAVMRNEKLSLKDMLIKASDIEREITRSINAGEVTYLKKIKIKEKNAYKDSEERSPYQYYVMWQKCFAPVYGDAPKPPYQAVRLPLDIASQTALKDWILSIDNQSVQSALGQYFAATGKGPVRSFPVPIEYCSMHGFPPELKAVLDTKKIILTLTKSYRNILESLGFFSKRDMLLIEQGY